MSGERPVHPRRGPGRLYLRVLIVQALTLLALWWLQSSFGGGA